MKIHVLILAHNFPPEFGGGAIMQYEMAKFLVSKGHKVTVIAPIPFHHMLDKNQATTNCDEVVDGIHIIRIKTPLSHASSIRSKLICELITDIRLVVKGLTIKPVDILFIMPQTSSLAVFSRPLKWIRRSISVLYLQDLYPEVLISMGLISRKNLLFRAAKVCEKIAYNSVDYIGVHSPRNRLYVLSCGVDINKVNVIPLWVDTGYIRTLVGENDFVKRYQLENKFVVMYAGTVGFAMGANTIPRTAKILEVHKDIQFVIVGGGSKLEEMQEEIKKLELKNLFILPPQPRKDLPAILASSDLLLVLLRKEQSNNPNGYFRAVIPHKMLSNMASGKPILLSAEINSDAAELVNHSNCGLVVPPENPEAMAKAILSMKQDKEKLSKWGQNGLEFVKNHFDSSMQVQRMEELFIKLVEKSSYQFNDPWRDKAELATKPH